MKTSVKTTIKFTVDCELTEQELRALDALAGYGFKSFIDCFYEHMGRHYLEPFAGDLEVLFKKVESLRPQIHEIREARRRLGLPIRYLNYGK